MVHNMDLFEWVQQSEHGGWREMAGRKPGDGGMVSHKTRDEVKPAWVMHVTWHLVPNLPSLWNGQVGKVMRDCVSKAKDQFGARIIEFSAPGNHIHVIVEAESPTRDTVHGLVSGYARARDSMRSQP
jgi:REP element-mobilizing transposase RayT